MWETFVCDDYWPIYFGGYGCVALPKVLGRRSSLSSCMLRNILEVRQNSTNTLFKTSTDIWKCCIAYSRANTQMLQIAQLPKLSQQIWRILFRLEQPLAIRQSGLRIHSDTLIFPRLFCHYWHKLIACRTDIHSKSTLLLLLKW